MPTGGQGFIKRNRAPRVHITYEDPYDANQLVELPFVMGVMSDLSGNASPVEKVALEERDFLEMDMDNFDKRMEAIRPAISMAVENRLDPESKEKLNLLMEFTKMDDFSPAAVARAVPATAKLLEAREQLSNLLTYMDGKMAASDQLKALLNNPDMMAALRERTQKTEAGSGGDGGDGEAS